MKLVKFEAVKDEFVRTTPRNMTVEDAMKKIATNLIAAVGNDGKGRGRTGRFVSYNAEKSKVFVRIKYGPTEVFCLEDTAKSLDEAKEKARAYAEALAAGAVSASEKEAIRKAMNVRRERMEAARAAKRAKKAA